MILLFVFIILCSAGFVVASGFSTRGTGDPSAAQGRLSIIIPARNEAHNLPLLLQSLAQQKEIPHEILVVDDGSTDDTAAIARSHGATVISSEPLPDGWRGKTWACHQGARAATGELLCFIDADTWFEPDGLARLLGAYPGGAFSVLPYHAVRRLYESLSLFFNFSMAAGTVPNTVDLTGWLSSCLKKIRRQGPTSGRSGRMERDYEPMEGSSSDSCVDSFATHSPDRCVERSLPFLRSSDAKATGLSTVPGGLAGQCLLVGREDYQKSGGHESVRGRVLENFRLAEGFREAGIPVASVTGRDMISFRMYPQGLASLVEGWTKGFASGAGRTSPGVLLLVVAWMTGLMLPLICGPITGEWWTWLAAYLIGAIQTGFLVRRLGSFHPVLIFFYPIPLIFFFGVFAWSALRSGKKVSWKGREIHAD